MSNMKKLVGLMLMIVFILAVAGCGSKVVAEVNGEKITKTQLDKRVEKIKLAYEQKGASFDNEQGKMMLEAIEKQTVDQMIMELLIKQAAEEKGIAPSKDELQKRFDEVRQGFNSEEEFKNALKSYKYTEEEVKEYIAQQATSDALYEQVTKDVKVTEEEIKEYFEANRNQFKEPEKIKARHILIRFNTEEEEVGRTEEEAKQIAEDLIAQLKDGADFSELAKEKSEDPASKTEDGLLRDSTGSEYFSRGIMVPEFEDAAFALEIGKYTDEPVKTKFGYHIIKCEDKKAAKELTFEESKEQIKRELTNQRKQEAFNKYLDDFKAKSEINNNLADEEAPAEPQMPADHPDVNSSKEAPADQPDTNTSGGEKPANHP